MIKAVQKLEIRDIPRIPASSRFKIFPGEGEQDITLKDDFDYVVATPGVNSQFFLLTERGFSTLSKLVDRPMFSDLLVTPLKDRCFLPSDLEKYGSTVPLKLFLKLRGR